MKKLTVWLSSCIAFAAMLPLSASALTAAELSVPQVRTAPPIDGSLDGAWKSAQSVPLSWDLQGHGPAVDATTAYVESDGKFLYVAFDAHQKETIVATQHTNDAGQGSDDQVQVDLWPGGVNGFNYEFSANPLGTHYQSSSENSGYRPQWWSAGTVKSGEYVVTMKIPLAALHGAQAETWRVEFSRKIEVTGDVDVWSYNTNQTDPSTSIYAGTMTGVRSIGTRPKPRLELYNLGSIAGASAGGSTARTGLDFSMPVSATSSFYGTLHPDYSNVEKDQQSISPTAYRRYYSEVRPFFTQGRAAYDNFNCNLCNGILTLYTPGIPTPRRGFAVEGKQGSLTYGAFDAAGVDRTDSAQAVSWRDPSHRFGLSAQRVGVYLPGVKDQALEVGGTFNDNKHVDVYFNYGTDAGSGVRDARNAQYYDLGAGWFSPTTAVGAVARKEGLYFNPADGYVWHTDTAGWGAFFSHAWLYGAASPVRSVTFSSATAIYHDRVGELNDTNQNASLDVLTRGLLDISLSTGSSYVRFAPGGTFYPVTQNGISLTFGSGAENSSVNNGAQHGSSATPTTISYSTGRFGPGRLNAVTLSSTLKASGRGLISLEFDGNTQLLDAGGSNREWLERLSYTYQSGRDESFALGVRRILGVPPIVDAAQSFPTGWNISAAYHRTFGDSDEIYAVYGDASAVVTVPQFIIKWIHYVGAGKGT